MKSKANGLMGDLESIKALLEEDDLASDEALWDIAQKPTKEPVQESVQEPVQETEVPVLQDQVSVDENTATTAAALDSLLGTEFHAETAQVMSKARSIIEQHPNQWTPQQTDELSDALRVRIDGAVQEWISRSLAAHTGELRHQLLNTVRDELARHLESFDTDPTPS